MAAVSLLDVGVAVAALALAGLAANRVGLSVIPAYIVAGIVIGPVPPESVAGVSLTLVDYTEFFEVVAELGIVFLLFFLGLEFSVDQLLGDGRRIAAAGSVDFALNFGAGLALGVAFGRTPLETFLLAGVVYISSSAVVTKSLIDRGWIANPEAQPILGTLVFEDVVIAVYLALAAALVSGTGGLAGAATDVAIAFAFLGALAALAWVGADAVDRLFDLPNDELFLLHVVAATTLVAGGALALGVSEAVAAFFVGTAFSETSHVERIERVVAPVRDLFAALFFLSIGFQTNVLELSAVPGLLVAAVVLTTATKLVSGTVGGRIYGLNATRSLRTGIGLVPRAEFSLVIAALVAGSGVAAIVPPFAVGYVLAMSVLGTVLIQHADAVTPRLAGLVSSSDGKL